MAKLTVFESLTNGTDAKKNKNSLREENKIHISVQDEDYNKSLIEIEKNQNKGLILYFYKGKSRIPVYLNYTAINKLKAELDNYK